MTTATTTATGIVTTPTAIDVFYDSECPICAREIALLRRLDRRGRIGFVDIVAPGFDAAAHGRTQDDLMGRLHGRLPDGSWVTGIEALRRLYSAVGFGPLVALTRLPLVRHALDLGYAWFAKNRLRLTGRCAGGTCPVPGR